MARVQVVPDTPSGPAPKVSVLITAYNHERYLSQALESALAQKTTFCFEIVVGEDCSTDGTRRLLHAYFMRYPDVIRMILPDENLGPNRMYLEVMRAARGKYFAILDGDDYWTSTDKLERQARFLDVNDAFHICFHDMWVVGEGDGGHPRPDMDDLGRTTYNFDDLLTRPFLPTSSILHRRMDAEEVNAWFRHVAPKDWEQLVLIDWLALLLFGQRGNAGYLSDLKGVHRVHDGGVWSSIDRLSQIDEEAKVFRYLLTVFETPAHLAIVRSGLQRCAVQEAVERLPLPYDRTVAVVSAPMTQPWYFNGRSVWHLVFDPQQDVASVIAALEGLRRSARPTAIRPHWLGSGSLIGAGGLSVYCVVVLPREWIGCSPELQTYFDRFTSLLVSEECSIYELRSQPVSERRVVAVRLAGPLPSRLLGRHIESPQPGMVTKGGMLELIGWVLDENGSVSEMRVTHGADVLARAGAGVARPDLAAAFPQATAAATAGFRMFIDLADVPGATELVVTACLQGGERVVLGEIEMAPP